MSNLHAKILGKLQGVPVENRQDEILGYIRELQLNGSPDSGLGVLKRLFKFSNKPLMLAYLKNESATSFHEETEKMANTNTIADTALSFIRDDNQSTSMENPIPQDMQANHKSITVYWNKLFHRVKSQSKDGAPEPQKPTAANEPADVQVQELQQVPNDPETQSANDLKKPLEESQEQQLTIETETKTPMKEQEAVQPNAPASDEVNLSVDQQPKPLKPKTPKKSSAKNATEEPILSLFKREHISVAADSKDMEPNPPSNDVNLPIVPKTEPLKPQTPKKSVEQTLGECKHLPVAAKPEDVKPTQPAFDPAEPKDAEPNLEASDKVNMPIDQEPDRLKPTTPKKKSAKNVSGEQILSPFECNRLSVAAGQEIVEPNHPVSDDVHLPIVPKPEGLKPQLSLKSSAENVSNEQILSNQFSVAAKQEDVKPIQPASDKTNPNP